MKINNFAKALGFWLKHFGISQSQLADRTDKSQGYISELVSGKKSPPFELAEEIAKSLGLELPQFLLMKDENVNPDEFSFVPKAKTILSAGSGSFEYEKEIEGYYSFRTQFLLGRGCSVSKCVLVEVTGDSMQPLLFDKDWVLLDTSKTEVIQGKIYAVAIENAVVVKRVERIRGGYLLRSENNTKYEPVKYELNDDNYSQFKIIGQVLWSCREY